MNHAEQWLVVGILDMLMLNLIRTFWIFVDLLYHLKTPWLTSEEFVNRTNLGQ